MSYPDTRAVTNTIIKLVEDGVLDAQDVLIACLNAMSEQEVKQMAQVNEFCFVCNICGNVVAFGCDHISAG